MRSAVADDARRALDARIKAMTPAERVDLAHELGEQALDIYCAVHHADRVAARKVFRRQRQAGRNPSRVMQSLLE